MHIKKKGDLIRALLSDLEGFFSDRSPCSESQRMLGEQIVRLQKSL